MTRARLILPCAWLVLSADVVRANEQPVPVAPANVASDVEGRRLTLQLGLGAPLGVIGVGHGWLLSEGFMLEAGIGLGYSDLQLSVMPTFSWGSRRYRFFSGLGGSWSSGCCFWLNADVAGYEFRGPGGGSFLVSLGATMAFEDFSTGGWFGAKVERFIPQPTIKLGGGFWVGGRHPDGGQGDADDADDGGHADSGSPVHASDMSGAVWRHRLSAQLGLGSALGLGGLAWTVAPWRSLRVETGVGYGKSGLQISLMPMITLGASRDKFIAGAGISLATLELVPPDPEPPTSPRPDKPGTPEPPRVESCREACLWLNIDLAGYEHTWRSGWSFFISGGVTSLLFRQSRWLRWDEIWAPQLRLGVGWGA